MGNINVKSTHTVTCGPGTSNFENRAHSPRDDERLSNKAYRQTRQEALEEMSPGLSHPNGSTPSASLPSFMQEIESKSPCNRIFNQYMTPGMRVSTKAGSNANFSAFIPANISDKDLNGNEAVLRVSKSFQGGQFDVHANTSGSFNGALYVQPNQAMKLGAMFDTNGVASISCETETDLCDDDDSPHRLHLGSRCEFQSPSKFNTWSDSKMTNVGGHAAVYLPNSVMAIEATAPIDTLRPDFSYHLSADVAEAAGSEGGHPLIMSMHKSNAKTSFSVTQLNKDLLWTLEMEKKANKSTSDIKAGLFYPLNEYIGTKIVATPSRLDGAIILRNPDLQAKCSLIFGADAKNASVTGIALELGS